MTPRYWCSRTSENDVHYTTGVASMANPATPLPATCCLKLNQEHGSYKHRTKGRIPPWLMGLIQRTKCCVHNVYSPSYDLFKVSPSTTLPWLEANLTLYFFFFFQQSLIFSCWFDFTVVKGGVNYTMVSQRRAISVDMLGKKCASEER